jgi:hypothetical protein
MENKYIVYKNDYNKLCNYGFNDVNLQLDSSIDDYISSNNILEQSGGKWNDENILDKFIKSFKRILPLVEDEFTISERLLVNNIKVNYFNFFHLKIGNTNYLFGYKEIYNNRGKCIILKINEKNVLGDNKQNVIEIDEKNVRQIDEKNVIEIDIETYNFLKKNIKEILDIEAVKRNDNRTCIYLLFKKIDSSPLHDDQDKPEKDTYYSEIIDDQDKPEKDTYYSEIIDGKVHLKIKVSENNIIGLLKNYKNSLVNPNIGLKKDVIERNLNDENNLRIIMYTKENINLSYYIRYLSINPPEYPSVDNIKEIITLDNLVKYYNLKENYYTLQDNDSYIHAIKIINNKITYIGNNLNDYYTERYIRDVKLKRYKLFFANIAIYFIIIYYIIKNKEKLKDLVKSIRNY